MKKTFWLSLFAGITFLSGCTSNTSNHPINNSTNPSKTQLPQSADKSTGQNQTALPVKKIGHIVVVIEENHARTQIIGNPSAPYMNSLAKQGACFTNYHAIEHPSQPNYLDIFSGSNQGVTSDSRPPTIFHTANLGSELIAAHFTFSGYSEDLPSVGFTGNQSGGSLTSWMPTYARKHNPWVNFANLPANVNKPFVDFPKDPSNLPTISFVIPNLKHDMHDGTIQQADTWLKDNLASYVQWAKTHNSLFIVTWDEDDTSHNNIVPTFFVGPMVKPGIYDQNWSHFNLLRTLEDLYGLPHAGQSASVPPILGIWK